MICEPEWQHARDKYNLVLMDDSPICDWDEEEGENYEVALERMMQ